MANLMEDELFRAFTTYAAIVIVKMLLMGPLTAYYRITRGSFANIEDVARKSADEQKKLLRTHPDVERVRRCHLNDLENIVPFLGIALLYTLTGPELSSALLHFRVFAGSRILHTISYVCALPQPCRSVGYFAGFIVTSSMAYRVLSTVLFL
ncbi:microsomal glutathione S-transferase 1-like [Chaetodon trifascialis]|uniref:microsomal glutathione S-transferase 1-like n=1 Tax=Chaetodon trifascialis TaxID=109706 RepID=UPI0039916E87